MALDIKGMTPLLQVFDMPTSLKFYCEVAGMGAGEIFDGQSEAFDTLTNNPGARLRGVHLTAGPFMLQLLEYKAGGGATLDLHHNKAGSPHLSFYVPDVEAKYAEVKQRGDVTITSGIVQIARNMRSSLREIAGFARALGLARIAVVAHDIGATVAQPLARLFPGLVTRLVLFDPPYPGVGRRWRVCF